VTIEDALDILRRPAWHARAACRGVGTEVFFPPERKGPNRETQAAYQAAAEQYCARCPVTVECLEAGQGEGHGLWGGQSPAQRRPRRRQAA
jgi:WhiB family redox-sensing transcriptional regulator